MPAARIVFRMLVAIAALFIVTACDDDERKNRQTKYDVTIYVSEHIVGEIVTVPAERRFAKPRIVVQAPEGVKVEHDETKPRKGKLVDFAPLNPFVPLAAFLSILLSCFVRVRQGYASDRLPSQPSPPVYQRG